MSRKYTSRVPGIMGKKKAIVLVSAIILGVLPAVSFSGCGDARPGFEEVMSEAVAAAAEVETYSTRQSSNGRSDPISPPQFLRYA
jgi:hypothetical protein